MDFWIHNLLWSGKKMFTPLEKAKIERSPSQTKPPKQRLAHEKHYIQDNLGSRYQMMKDYLVSF